MNFNDFERFLSSFITMGIPGYDCIVMHHGKEVFRKMNGYSDLENKIPMNGKERYHIYSCSKVLTCAAALQLWEKGAYQLDDPLYLYMPEFEKMTVRTENGIVPAKNQIRVRNLFTMTAGFDYNVASESLCRAYDETRGACPTRKTMEYLAQEPLAFEPGAMWNYSLCHDVLGAFIEVVSGIKFQDYVQKYIFEPLGMKNSTFLLPASERNTVAPTYKRDDRCSLIYRLADHTAFSHLYRLGAEYASGGAGCVSTVDDYILFLEALRQGDVILKKETIDSMTSNQLTEAQTETYWNKGLHHYGLGVRCPLPGRTTDFGWGG